MTALLQVMDQRERAFLARCAFLPISLVSFMRLLSHLGNGWLWFATLAFVLSGPSSGPSRVLLSAALANLAIALFKGSVRRPRPVSEAALVAGSPLGFDRFSFPSGHATNAFAWAGCAASFAPTMVSVFLALALAIAISRVLLRIHFPSDVVAGGLLGWALSLLAARVVV